MGKLNFMGINSVTLTFLDTSHVMTFAKDKPIAASCRISDANTDELNLHYDFDATGSSTRGRLIGEPKVDYRPTWAMLMWGGFSHEELSKKLSKRAVSNIETAIGKYIHDGDIRHKEEPNYLRHPTKFPRIKDIDYQQLARNIASPQFSFQVEGNLSFRMATNLFNTYKNMYALQTGK